MEATLAGLSFRKMLMLVCSVSAIALLSVGCLPQFTESSNRLVYNLPTELTVSAGSELPGTGIRYERMDDKGAYLLIKGQQALKRKGDSVSWSGYLAPGVAADLRLRIVWYTDKAIYLVGTAKMAIEGAQPQAVPIVTSSAVKFAGPVAYSANRGAVIPGTTVVYLDKTADGAKLGGVEGYAFRQMGDSLIWEGTLRERVYCRLEARVIQYDEKGIRVGGLVTLWLGP